MHGNDEIQTVKKIKRSKRNINAVNCLRKKKEHVCLRIWYHCQLTTTNKKRTAVDKWMMRFFKVFYSLKHAEEFGFGFFSYSKHITKDHMDAKRERERKVPLVLDGDRSFFFRDFAAVMGSAPAAAFRMAFRRVCARGSPWSAALTYHTFASRASGWQPMPVSVKNPNVYSAFGRPVPD